MLVVLWIKRNHITTEWAQSKGGCAIVLCPLVRDRLFAEQTLEKRVKLTETQDTLLSGHITQGLEACCVRTLNFILSEMRSHRRVMSGV